VLQRARERHARHGRVDRDRGADALAAVGDGNGDAGKARVELLVVGGVAARADGGELGREAARFGDRGVGVAGKRKLRDDALDYEAGEEALGKIPNMDIREGKVTLPLLLALKRCTSAEREMVAVLIKNVSRIADPGAAASGGSTAIELAPVLDLIARYRGVEDTVRRAQEHAERAIASIAPFPDSEAKEDLTAAAHFAVTRDR